MSRKEQAAIALINDMIKVVVKDRANGITTQQTDIVEGWLRMIKLKLV